MLTVKEIQGDFERLIGLAEALCDKGNAPPGWSDAVEMGREAAASMLKHHEVLQTQLDNLREERETSEQIGFAHGYGEAIVDLQKLLPHLPVSSKIDKVPEGRLLTRWEKQRRMLKRVAAQASQKGHVKASQILHQLLTDFEKLR